MKKTAMKSNLREMDLLNLSITDLKQENLILKKMIRSAKVENVMLEKEVQIILEGNEFRK
ncbi:hypothetical protein [uncultured Draconibacterium sp.]|uniref:hypothetical protein n=1 Tax=uncultured Draconibacterium sp. TaxID=1573823 RepID=UPI002AA722CF|nr:hypothetical protein [uncultured Draconibacterium sp.]